MKKIIVSLIVLSATIFAHQVTAEKSKNNTFVPKFWAHGEYNEFEAKQLKGAQAYDENNSKIKTGIDYNNLTILTAKEPAMISLNFDAGYWVEGENGYENIAPSKYKGIVYDTLKSVKYGKRYFKWNESFVNPIGLNFEVIALINPFKVKVGEKLPVLVIKDAKPLANAVFETSDYENLNIKTNKYGIANIPIKSKGLQIIAAIYDSNQISDPNVNNITIQSSISFEVK